MTKNKVLKSSFLVMLFIILGKIFALMRDSLIAAKFGATYTTDIYNFALGMVYLLTTISYGLTTTFIPLNIEHIQKSTQKDRVKFVNNIINVSAIFTIVLTVILIFGTKEIIYYFGHGFTTDINIFNTAVEVTRIMLLSLIFLSIQSVLTGVLQSHKQFLEPSAMAAVSNVIYIIYLVFFAASYGIKGFAIATVIGFFAQYIINVPKYKSLGYKYSSYINLKDEALAKITKLMVPVIISTSVVQLNMFVNRSFANNLYGGAVTILDCSNKINTLAYEVFAIGIGMIVYPTLSQYAAEKNIEEYKKQLKRAINLILMVMIPAAIGILVLRKELVIFIFKRGLFTENAVDLTSKALFYYAPAMIFYGLRDILNRAFYSIQDTKTPMINSFIGILLNILLNIVLINKMGVAGLTLATTLSVLITTFIMFISLSKKIKVINIREFLKTLSKITIASLIMGTVVLIVKKYCYLYVENVMTTSIISIVLGGISGIIVFATMLYFLKVEEFIMLKNSLVKKKSRV